MKEIVFINNNKKKWEEFEKLLRQPSDVDPDVIADLYIQLTDDLSYSRTYYPKSTITTYLNQLSMRVHQVIYINKKREKGSFSRFWIQDLPLILYKVRFQLLYSLIIFLVAVSIGIISTHGDQSFLRVILGDAYVNMTIDNIQNNDPMAVYKQQGRTTMFLAITINNIKVSFLAFVLGVFTAIGTGYILLNNGVMLGSFISFFVKYGLFWESTRVIWIHGTLEISAIVIAGAAGLVLGNSLIFPGTLSRKQSFIIGAGKGLRIVLGLVPIFIVAGFLEGFVTRLTDMPIVLSWTIIILSAFFIVWYFVIYPRYVYNKLKIK